MATWEEAEARARQAVALWEAFPVRAQPRPLVLTGPAVALRGFTSSDAKQAFQRGAVGGGLSLPDGLLDVMCPRREPSAGRRLRVLGVERTTGLFDTDRWPVPLPAWTVDLEEGLGPALVLDPQAAATAWHPAGTADGARKPAARLAADGRSLTVSILGGDPAYTDHPRVETVETPTALCVITVARDVEPQSGFRHPVAYIHRVTATLTDPLAARVLVDPSGTPVCVRPSRT